MKSRQRPAWYRHRSGNTTPGRSRKAPWREWVGGFLQPEFDLDRSDLTVPPGVVLWLELPGKSIVGNSIEFGEGSTEAVVRVLRKALSAPLVGSPRKPDIIRVADHATAEELRAKVPGRIPVKVAPTPELDALEKYLAAMPLAEEVAQPSYLAGAGIPPETVDKLFEASRLLLKSEPWTKLYDDNVIRVDIPLLGVNGACISVLGELGECLGVLIFPSLQDFQKFEHLAQTVVIPKDTADLGTDILALTFDDLEEVPSSLRREAREHGWPLDETGFCPVLERRGPDGMPQPPSKLDCEVATACARSVSALVDKHGAALESGVVAPIRESYPDDRGSEIRLAFPYSFSPVPDPTEYDDLYLAHNVTPTPMPGDFRPRVGRTDPCPCDSGIPYERCHRAVDEERFKARAIHQLDRRLVDRLSAFALTELPEKWSDFKDVFVDWEASTSLAAPWSVYGFDVGGRTVAAAYRDTHAGHCSPEELSLLDAQLGTWLSVWQVEEVEPGNLLRLRDLLSDGLRTVQEERASQTLARRDAVLGRVLDHDGISVLSGTHQNLLPHPFGAAVADRARLRRKRAVPVRRLLNPAFGRYLIYSWEQAVGRLYPNRPSA